MGSAKRGSRWAAVAGLVLTAAVIVVGNAHLCHLQSTVIEVGMGLALPLATWYWATRAATPARAWLRVGISLVVVVALENAYLNWLHSPSFPRALLSERAKKRQAEIEALRAKVAAGALPVQPAEDIEGP